MCNDGTGEAITLGQFVLLLWEGILRNRGYEEKNLLLRGQQEGWLAAGMETWAARRLNRGRAAELLHGILKGVLQEPEEEDWSAALQVRDLFDCHTCVMHVAQMLAKGIMEPLQTEAGELVFERDRLLTGAEAELLLKRLQYPEYRRTVPRKKKTGGARRVSRREAMLLAGQEGVLTVNVGQEELTGQLAGAVRIPMIRILENPYLLTERRAQLYLLYCEAGAQSEIAAECLAEHGAAALWFGLEEEERKENE